MRPAHILGGALAPPGLPPWAALSLTLGSPLSAFGRRFRPRPARRPLLAAALSLRSVRRLGRRSRSRPARRFWAALSLRSVRRPLLSGAAPARRFPLSGAALARARFAAFGRRSRSARFAASVGRRSRPRSVRRTLLAAPPSPALGSPLRWGGALAHARFAAFCFSGAFCAALVQKLLKK